MEFTQVIGLAVDLGLCVLIWIVQLVVYPGFGYYSSEEFNRWHSRYTWRITAIVFPLMMLQLGLAGLDVWSGWDWMNTLSLILIIGTWLSTFVQFVPLHNRLGQGNEVAPVIQMMVRKNWLRTCLWTAIFVISLLEICKEY